MPESEIATALNAQGIRTDFGRMWTRGTVHQVLTNEKWVGTMSITAHPSAEAKARRQSPGAMGAGARSV